MNMIITTAAIADNAIMNDFLTAYINSISIVIAAAAAASLSSCQPPQVLLHITMLLPKRLPLPLPRGLQSNSIEYIADICSIQTVPHADASDQPRSGGGGGLGHSQQV